MKESQRPQYLVPNREQEESLNTRYKVESSVVWLLEGTPEESQLNHSMKQIIMVHIIQSIKDLKITSVIDTTTYSNNVQGRTFYKSSRASPSIEPPNTRQYVVPYHSKLHKENPTLMNWSRKDWFTFLIFVIVINSKFKCSINL